MKQMKKADELAQKLCMNCKDNRTCGFICNFVLMELWSECHKSPLEMNDIMRSAREKIRLKMSDKK